MSDYGVLRAPALNARNSYEETTAQHHYAAILCLCGFIAHMVLSGSLLNSIGLHYSSEQGSYYERFHPGSLLILLGFVVFLVEYNNPLSQIINIFRQEMFLACFLLLYILLVIYMGMRSGIGGLAFIIDTHMTAVICALLLSTASARICRIGLYIFIIFAALNSFIGIIESIGKFRIFTYESDWVVLHEYYFRASALLGHPLNNAMFTSVAVFITLATRMPLFTKVSLETLFVCGLVVFGGRAGIMYSVAGLLFYCVVMLMHQIRARNLSTAQTFLLAGAAILVPVCLLGGVWMLLQSDMGERLATHAHWDDSANSRALALAVFDFLTWPEFVFGISSERIVEVAYRMNLVIPLSDIENPWLLMFLNLGVIMFSFWFLGVLAFIYYLMKDQPLAIKLAVLAYFVTASTSNSFGRKDSILLIMVSAVMLTRTLYKNNNPVTP